ncbi:unnamed protein product [Caenorhabditis brenneri]
MCAAIEVPVKFKDEEKPSILREARIIKMCPVLKRALEVKNANWETDGLKMEDPIELPITKEAGDFCFTYGDKYVQPDVEKDDPSLDQYKEANEKGLEELKEILEAASFFEMSSFMHCLGFVAAKKLNDKPVEEIAKYIGVECLPETPMFSEADGWIHAPNELFQNN